MVGGRDDRREGWREGGMACSVCAFVNERAFTVYLPARPSACPSVAYLLYPRELMDIVATFSQEEKNEFVEVFQLDKEIGFMIADAATRRTGRLIKMV